MLSKCAGGAFVTKEPKRAVLARWKLSADRLTDEVEKRQRGHLIRSSVRTGAPSPPGEGFEKRLPCAVGRSYYTFDVSREEHRAMPACEKPPARRADVYLFTDHLQSFSAWFKAGLVCCTQMKQGDDRNVRVHFSAP